jgi:phytoene dehydrogenase-like protein
MPLCGIIVALGASASLNGFRLIKGKTMMTVEVVTLAYFAGAFAITAGLGSPLFLNLGRPLAYLVLSGTAFGSLASRNPFTSQYARQDWPLEYWDNPVFRATNNAITGVWGFIFLAAAIVYQAGSFIGNSDLSVLLPNTLLGLGIAFSITYPKWHVRRALQRLNGETSVSVWPSPTLAGGGALAKNEYDVAIVGSGIGGLSTGALLAKRGLKVLVAEQHYLPGGYCTSFPRRGHSTFDAGVHDISGLGPKGPVRLMLRELGIENELEFRRVTSEYILPGIRFQVPHDWKDFVELLGGYFPAEKENILAFFDEMKGIYDDIYRDADERNGVIGPPQTAEERMRYPLTHRNLFRWLNKTYLEMLDEYFADARLKKVLLSLTAYLTDNPKALKSFSMAPIFGYYFDGGYYPKGGSQALADALVSVIRSNGGTVLLNTRVTRILVKEGAANGISVEGMLSRRGQVDVYNAGIIVSNADVKQTFLRLVDPSNLPADFLDRVRGIEPSTSAFMVFLSLDYDPPLAPLAFYTPDTGRGMGIAIPSKLDPDLAACGGSAMTIITLIPNSEARNWNRDAPDYKIRKERFMEEIVDAASELLPDLRKHIVYKEAATPATFLRYTSSSDGAIYGPKLDQGISFKSPIRNLYLVGSGTFPGAGVEAVTVSALIAANDILPRSVEVKREERTKEESRTRPYLTAQV